MTCHVYFISKLHRLFFAWDSGFRYVECFDLSDETWATGPSLTVARFGVAAATVGGQLLAVAGSGARDGRIASLGVLERYNTTSDTWDVMPSCSTTRANVSIDDHCDKPPHCNFGALRADFARCLRRLRQI